MSGTAKTTSQLYTELPDNTTGAIVPADIRDVVASGPQWDVVSAAAAPGILRGYVELGDYVTRNGGAVGAGQVLATRQTNATQAQNAFNYCATNGKFLEFAPNIIEIDNTTGITTPTTAFNDFRMYGAMEASSLRQFHTGASVLTLGGTDGVNNVASIIVDGIGLVYAGATATGSQVLRIGSIFFSNVSNVQMNGNGACDNIITAGGTQATGIVPFSNHFDNMNGSNSNAAFLEYNGSTSGNVWTNCYFQNGGATLSNACIAIGLQEGSAATESTFDQLNVEHCKVNNCMLMNGGSATFLGCHWEDIELTGSNPTFWFLAGGSGCNVSIIGGATFDLGLNSSLMTGTAVYFQLFDDCNVSMRSHNFDTSGSPSVVRNMQLQMYGKPTSQAPTGVTRSICKIEDTSFDFGYYGFMSLDTTLTRTTYGEIALVDGYRGSTVFPRITGRTVVNDPVTAQIIYGALGPDIIVRYNNPLTANVTLTLATLLVSGGTLNRPALDQVLVIREASCTGAFTITVRNAALSTIGAAFTTTSAGTSKVYIHTTTPGTWTQTV